jgi:PAS domain S-box-containing protein
MKNNSNLSKTDLRRQAEAKLSERKKKATALPATESDTRRLIYELEVHQIELEMQNEELLQSHAKVEAGLRQYTDLYDFAPVGYFTLARDGAIHQVNLVGANLLGVKHGALIKRRFGVFVSGRSRTTFNAFLEKVFSTSGSKETCEVALHKDGSAPLWVHIEGITEDGQREACRAVVMDITERKQAEDTLHKSEEKFRLLYTSIDQGVALHEIITDADNKPVDGVYVDINESYTKLLGITREAIGKRIREVVPLIEQYWIDVFGKVALTGEPVYYENYFETTGRYYSTHAYSPQKNQFAVLVTDITERKRAEEALRESEKLYHSLFENMLNGFAYCKMLFDQEQAQDFVYLEVNDAFEKLTGLKDVVGKKATEIIPGIREKDPELFEIYGRVALTGKPETLEIYVASLGMWHSVSLYSPRKGYFISVFNNITERKQAEEELKKSEEKYRGIFENVQDVYYESSVDGTILEVSPSIEIFSRGQYHRDELIGKSMYDFYSEPAKRQAFLAALQARGRVTDFEIAMKNRDGSQVPCSISAKIQFDAQGTLLKIIGSMRDITERKRAQEELEKSEEKYRGIFENVQDVYYETSFDGTILEVSPSIEFISKGQYHRADLIGKSMYEFYADTKDRDIFIAAMKKIGSVTDFEVQLKNRDDSLIHCSISAKMRFNAEGRPEKIIGSMHNVSDRKQAEQELRESETRYRSVLQSATDAIVTSDSSGIIIGWNSGAERIFGYGYTEAVGQPLTSILPLYHAGHPNGMKRVQSGGDQDVIGKTVELEGLRKDKSVFPIEFSLSTWESKSGQFFTAIIRDITERKRAEEALRESEEKYRSLVDGASEAILVVQEGMVKFVNLRVVEVTGYSGPDLMGKPFSEFIYPDDRQMVMDNYVKRTKSEPAPLRYEFRLLSVDGSAKWLEINTVQIDWNGKPASLIFLTDITERKRAEEALRKSEERFRSIYENSTIGLYRTSPDGKIILANPALVKMLGYSSFAELSARNLEKEGFEPTYQRKKFLEEIDKEGVVKGLESVWICQDGKAIFVRESASAIRDEKGNTLYYDGTVEDITERKHAEDALRASEERYKELFENNPQPMWVSDRKTLSFLAVNEAAVKHYGYSREEFLSMTIQDIHPPEFRVPLSETVAKSTDVLQKVGVWQHRKKDGSLIDVEITTHKLDFNARPARLVLAIDITERKQAEESKKNLEGQLQQAQKLESVGTLASGIAHDFNNILGIILGHSSLLERLREDSKMHSESVAAITKATQRGAGLVKQLMLFARKTEALLESVKVNDIITEITKLMQETFPKTIIISTSLQKDLPAIVADASQIHQVLLNLFVNARDAMPNSGTLSISTRTIDGKAVSSRFSKVTRDRVTRQYVQIEVTDTGIGMDEATRQRIFEPFFTTKGVGKGTGLGLAVVFGIVEHHSGFIDVRSAPGEGTIFTVYLPIPERAPEIQQRVSKSIEEIPGGTETILVIEDEEMLKDLVKVSLVSKGYTVLTAEDGMQGVEMYQSHQKEITVVLSDVGLPLLSGQDVFRKIREINPEAKVILASGFFDPETKSEMFKAGLKNFIQKPYMHDEVLQKIREVIDAK